MNKEVISDKQGIALIIMFLIGTTTLSVFGIIAKESFWICIILALIIELIIVLIFISLKKKFPDKNLFDAIEICFGKYIGKIIIFFLACYFLDDVILILVNFSRIISLTTLKNTPEMVIRIAIMFLCMVSVKKGIEVIGRWAEFMVLVFIFPVIMSMFFSIPNMDINNIMPVFDIDIKSVLKGTFYTVTFPFGELIAFTTVFSNLKTQKSASKIYIKGLLIGGIILLLLSVMHVLVIGSNIASIYYYPGYTTYSRIEIGGFFQRAEVLLAITFVLGSFVKISIALLAFSKSVSKIFKFSDYRFIIVPISLLILTISYGYLENIMAYWDYNNEIWSYYVVVVQIIFPIILFVMAEFKKEKGKYN